MASLWCLHFPGPPFSSVIIFQRHYFPVLSFAVHSFLASPNSTLKDNKMQQKTFVKILNFTILARELKMTRNRLLLYCCKIDTAHYLKATVQFHFGLYKVA